MEDGTKENRSCFGKISYTTNEADLDAVERASQAVADSRRDIPIITISKARGPVVPAEFESLVGGFGLGCDGSPIQ